MRLEDQVCSLRQSQKLKELGVLLISALSYEVDTGELVYNADGCPVEDLYIPAYTVAELGVLLGKYTVMKYAGEKYWRLYDEKGVLREFIFSVENEAQARASALILLLENNYVKAENLKL